MKVGVFYFSRTGNTKAVAETIASELNVAAQSIEEPLAAPYDVLFVGGGIYMGKLDKHLVNFIEKLTPDQIN